MQLRWIATALWPLAIAGLVPQLQDVADTWEVGMPPPALDDAAIASQSSPPTVESCSTNAECLAKGLPLLAPRHPFARGVLQPRADEIVTFGWSGTVQQFTAPRTGEYTFIIRGADGGSSIDQSLPRTGGRGAFFNASMTLAQGTTFNIVVGGLGEGSTSAYASHGGGGGTWLYGTRIVGSSVVDDLLIVAGGGGGGWYTPYKGGDASLDTNPTMPNPSTIYTGNPGNGATGSGGGGGRADGTYQGGGNNGGGGAGWNGDGESGITPAATPLNDIAQGKGGRSVRSGWGIGAGSTNRDGTRFGGSGGYGGGGGAGWNSGGGGGGWAGGSGGAGYDFTGGKTTAATGGGGGSSWWRSDVRITAASLTSTVGDGSVTVILPPA